MRFGILNTGIIIGYLGSLFLVGVYFSKRQTSRETYFLGNRQMPWFLVGVSVIASLLSTVTYLATPGEVIRYGLGYFSSLLAYILVVPIVDRIIIPVLMRLPVTSVYECIENRFSLATRNLSASTFVLARLIWIGLIIYTASFAVSGMTGWAVPSIVLIIGIVVTSYTTLGGITTVIWTDFAQFTLLFGGAVFIPFYVAYVTGTGPMGWFHLFSKAGRTHVPIFSLDPTVRISVLGMILLELTWNVCTHGADQVAAQRYLTTPSAEKARRSVWVFAVSNVGLIVLLMVSGLALFFFYFRHADLPLQQFQATVAPRADKLFPEFIATQLPTGISGLILAALVGSAMSSASSGMNSISTVVVNDFLHRFNLLRRFQDGVTVPKLVTVLVGVSGMAVAITVSIFMQHHQWNLVDLMQRVSNLFVAPLGALFLAGILLGRVGSRAAMIGFGAGTITSFTISFSQEFFGLRHTVSFMWIMPLSFGVSLGVSFLVGHFFPPPTEAQLKIMTLGLRPPGW
jgi:solute:Na+ symporter, SSS family